MSKIWSRAALAALVGISVLFCTPARAQRQMEALGRGVVAVNRGDGQVYVGWRLLGTDPDGIAFNLYRSTAGAAPIKRNPEPLRDSTNFVDPDVPLDQPNAYFVRPVLDGREQEASAPYLLKANAPAQQYIEVPVQTPQGYSPNDASVGDLDGDGEYEIVIHMTGRGRDNASPGKTDVPILQAYELDGTLLWAINLGKNIREGAHYTQFMVYDLDGDGKAELACKTADGTVDGKGKVIGDPMADHVGTNGKILAGPEYFTVFDGQTGAALATADYLPPRGDIGGWGGIGGNGNNDANGNRVDRFLACVAYLDGRLPSVVMCRGYYGRTVLAAWDWRGGKLTSRWVFDTERGYPTFAGQGNHSLSVADVDNDGKDEIVYGSMVVDDDGKGLFSTGMRHGDALHVSDLDPSRPGLEVFGIHENEGRARSSPGMAMYDAGSGEILWKAAQGEDVGKGLAADIDPRSPGAECWGGPGGLRTCKGEPVGPAPRSTNYVIWWDGDLLREVLAGNRVTKWDWRNQTLEDVFTATGCTSNNTSKATPCLSADLFGDWREEIIFRTSDNQKLRIYTTTIPTDHRITTLMHDPQYRLAIAWQNVGYNQPPHPSFFLGDGMKPPPRPSIITVLSPSPSPLPTVYIAGDSTAANGGPGAIGWGKHLGAFFDPAKLKVVNQARGGRSSRTFITEGLWDRLLDDVKAGDIVLIQFGHNDGGAINDGSRARGSLPGLGDESQEIDNLITKKHEVVRTFGWYVRKMIADAKAKGATPILLSLTVRNVWKDGRVERGSGRYGEWMRELAKSERVPFIDLTRLVGDRYEQMGEEAVKALFPRDHTHTSEEGAKLNATLVVSGIKGLRDQSIVRTLSAAGRTVPTAVPDAVSVGQKRGPTLGPGPAESQRWANLPEPGDPALPSLFLIGDSTVRTGRGDGGDGQFGWGDPLEESFDRAKINVVNRAVGGTGAGTFIAQGYWDPVLAMLKPGDVVIMQFGHNDNGPRGALKGVGEETEQRRNSATNQTDTIHTFGWYLRKYISDTRARGATPIVCSLIPRNRWRDDKIVRTSNGHADWARAVAESEKAAFIDLHEIIARRYDVLGEPAVGPLFADARVHTSWAGAVLNAECVIAGLKALPEDPLAPFFLAAEKPAPSP